MKLVYSLALLAVFALSTSVVAQETTDAPKCTKCPASKTTTVVTASTTTEKTDCPGACEKTCSTCAVSTAMKALPKMTYAVGTESTCCSEAAAELAKKSGEPIHFVVGDKKFTDKTEAYTALVDSTESFVNAYVTPAKCEKSGTTTVAGKSCGCCVEAGKRTELVSAAIKDIKMSYKVGDKEACCPNAAAALAKETGAATHYVVNGEETPCSLTARMKVATAKYEAAVKAITAAEQTATADAPKTEATAGTSGT